jgi:hypothetical protein
MEQESQDIKPKKLDRRSVTALENLKLGRA